MARWLRVFGLCCLLGLTAAGCGDDVRGELRLLVVPLHQGRNPIQDPFSLVAEVELGWTAADGSYRTLGRDAPDARFGPGLLGALERGAPTLVGLNERGRPVSRGFGRPQQLAAGIDAVISVPFARIDHALARRVPAAGLADPFADQPPALRLDAANLEQGQLADEDDAGCLAWILWDDDGLWLDARLRDDAVEPAGMGPPADGDALVIYLDPQADGVADDPNDRLIQVGADGRVAPEGAAEEVEVASVAGGWRVRLRVPLPGGSKNQQLGFDLRQVDFDGGGPPLLLTWTFDPQAQGADPEADQFGRLVLGTALLDLLRLPGAEQRIDAPDGQVRLGGWWDAEALHLTVEVPDDDVQSAAGGEGLAGADRIELWLDLDNARPPLAQTRFFRLSATAGGDARLAGGPEPANVTEQGFAYSGRVEAASRGDGYRVDASLPWADLRLDEPPQRGWFFGLQLRLVDEDAGDSSETWWAAGADRPQVWNELRLFSTE